MRFRFGLLVGAAIGYYLGTRDGRQRYEQINKSLTKLQQNPRVAEATEKAKALVDQGVAQAKQVADQRGGMSGIVHSTAETVMSKVGPENAQPSPEVQQPSPEVKKQERDAPSSADPKDEPVPYTNPTYDPDKSGRPPASTPKNLSGTVGEKAGTDKGTVGDGGDRRREPQPYVDPSHDPAKPQQGTAKPGNGPTKPEKGATKPKAD